MSNLSKAVKKTLVQVSLASFLMLGFLPLNAQETINGIPADVNIRYIGKLDNQPVFQIDFENTTGDNYRISIQDEQGITLYSERSKERQYTKKFQLDRNDLNGMKLTFILTNEKDKQSRVFEVNANTRVIEDVVVTKM